MEYREDLFAISAVITGRGMVGVDCLNSKSGLEGKNKKAIWCDEGERAVRAMHGGTNMQEWKEIAEQQHSVDLREA